MIARIVAFVAGHAGLQRPKAVRILALGVGFCGFFVVIPLLLGLAGHAVARSAGLAIPRSVEIPLGLGAAISGLCLLLWAVWAFWFVGGGTPAPFASPLRLVTEGPFRYTRNPIMLSGILFYFGVGTLWDRWVTGLVMFAIAGLLGTLYHKGIEEKELLARFGVQYEAYRRRTSFLIPLPPKPKRD